MFKNKLVNIMIILLLVIALVGTVTVIIIQKVNAKPTNGKLSIDQIIEYSVDEPEITTNLYNGDFIKISYKIQTSNKDAKAELTKRDFQVKNIIIQQLSQMKSEQFKQKNSITNLENTIKNQLNNIMQDGKVERVYTTSFILQ
ncbi:flagellar basal body-associated protein FliL [Bacillus sp. RG28]|uniref:Flagellar protein FliL n=1 Tax=Gottfriedia endophytica TaxID=2820819 RepID=A0A940NSH8_9BACI|nr:flagellar basal body-associated protein FliL [Gottfriedia endophytica]MBP0726232.1 flagellar basal body-associated protein FliL [Gottfriedia endophytica]